MFQFLPKVSGQIIFSILLFLIAGCASTGPRQLSNKFGYQILDDFHNHPHNQLTSKGEDYVGSPYVVATSPGVVTGAGELLNGPNAGMFRVIVRGALGEKTGYACLSEVFVNVGQKVDELTPIGLDGPNCPGKYATHTHLDREVVPWAIPFGNDEYYPYWRENQRENLVVNPNLFAVNGKKLTLFEGKSNYGQLVNEATNRLNRLGEKHKDTLLGWFLQNTKERTPYERWLVAWRMWQRKTLPSKELVKDVENELKWSANIKPNSFVPYPNERIKDRYKKIGNNGLDDRAVRDIRRSFYLNYTEKINDPEVQAEMAPKYLELAKKYQDQGIHRTYKLLAHAHKINGEVLLNAMKYIPAAQHFEKSTVYHLMSEAFSEVEIYNTKSFVGMFKFWSKRGTESSYKMTLRAYEGMKEQKLSKPNMIPVDNLLKDFSAISRETDKFREFRHLKPY